jgi:hypothetical protein
MNDLSALVVADSLGAMAVAESDDLREVGASLRLSSPIILDNYSRVAGTLSEQFYMDERAKAGVKGRYTPILKALDIPSSVDDTIGWTLSRLAAGTPFDVASGIFAGAISRSVLSVDRLSIVSNARAEGIKYRRIASPLGCEFCLYAAAVADVVSENADRYHDHCRCTVVPMFDGRLDDVPDYYEQMENDYGDARSILQERRAAIEDTWRAEQAAAGKRVTTRRFLAANPDLAINSKNLLREIRIIRAGR